MIKPPKRSCDELAKRPPGCPIRTRRASSSPITVGLGIQYAILCIASVVLTPTAMITVAGRRLRLKTRLTPGILSEIHDFMVKFAARKGLGEEMAMLSEGAPSVGEETPLRLLRHYASSIRHQQYHDIDILSIRVESAAQLRPGIE